MVLGLLRAGSHFCLNEIFRGVMGGSSKRNTISERRGRTCAWRHSKIFREGMSWAGAQPENGFFGAGLHAVSFGMDLELD